MVQCINSEERKDFMNPIDPVQVWEEEAGPNDPDGHRYAYVAYRDPESDSGRYGYGHDPNAAILDYLDQEMEHICSNCDGACGQDPDAADDCIMIEPNRSNYLRAHMPEDDRSHREWREINGPRMF